MSKDVSSIVVSPDVTLFDALAVLNEAGGKTLIVTDESGILLGVLTDGDVRRHILAGRSLDEPVSSAMNEHPIWADASWSREQLRATFTSREIDCIPVLDASRKVVSAVWWTDLFGMNPRPRRLVNVPVVLMAGGKGTRLDPFTRILPKPLVPVGDRAVLQLIMDGFNEQGCDRFLVALNHKASLVRAYFAEEQLPYEIIFFNEDRPLGTAGGLGLMRDELDSTFLLGNCDTVLDTSIAGVVDFHRERQNLVTIIASMKHLVLPYGVCEVGKQGSLDRLREKPRFDMLVSTGVYVMEPGVLDLMETGARVDATDLIEAVRVSGGSVGAFPIPEHAWVDIGQLEELQTALDRLKVR